MGVVEDELYIKGEGEQDGSASQMKMEEKQTQTVFKKLKSTSNLWGLLLIREYCCLEYPDQWLRFREELLKFEFLPARRY